MSADDIANVAKKSRRQVLKVAVIDRLPEKYIGILFMTTAMAETHQEMDELFSGTLSHTLTLLSLQMGRNILWLTRTTQMTLEVKDAIKWKCSVTLTWSCGLTGSNRRM